MTWSHTGTGTDSVTSQPVPNNAMAYRTGRAIVPKYPIMRTHENNSITAASAHTGTYFLELHEQYEPLPPTRHTSTSPSQDKRWRIQSHFVFDGVASLAISYSGVRRYPVQEWWSRYKATCEWQAVWSRLTVALAYFILLLADYHRTAVLLYSCRLFVTSK